MNNLKISKILIVVIIIIVVILVIIVSIKLNPVRKIKFSNREYLFELDDNYEFKKHIISGGKYRVVISMTTIPDRLDKLHPSLCSLLDQTVKVDKIYLNLPRISRKGKPYILPAWFERLKNITVNWLEKDFGPSSKLLPILKSENPNTRIIVVDDDNIYHRNTIAMLINEFDRKNSDCPKNPKIAISQYGVILNSDGTLPRFSSLARTKIFFQKSQQVDHLQGCFGFVVTPKMFTEEVFNQDVAPDCVKSVDDVWFSCWLRLNNIEIWTISYSFWTVPPHDYGEVNRTTRLFDGENAGFIPEHKTLEWFRETHGYCNIKMKNKNK